MDSFFDFRKEILRSIFFENKKNLFVPRYRWTERIEHRNKRCNDYLLNNGRHRWITNLGESKRKGSKYFPFWTVSLWLRPIKRFRFSSCIPGVWIAVVIRTAQSRLMERLQAICMEIEKHNRGMRRRVWFIVSRFIYRRSVHLMPVIVTGYYVNSWLLIRA